MNIGLVILLVLLILGYIMIRLMQPVPVRLSRFEVERRAREGDERAHRQLERFHAAPFVSALRWFLSSIFVLIITSVLVGLYGGFGGVFIALAMVLVVAWLERVTFLKRIGDRLYGRLESRLVTLSGVRKYFFFLPVENVTDDAHITSEAELLHLLDGATFLEPERRVLIHSALEFTGLSVSDAMSGRRSIRPVDKADVLGPLVLDELYKTGRQAFVVIDGDLDTVVGILTLERLTSLDMKDSPTALKAMSPDAQFIDADAPITDGLSYLRSSKAPFLIVQNTDGTTAGLLTLDNILRCLFASE